MANSDPIGGSPMPDRGQQSLSIIAQVVTAVCVVITLVICLATFLLGLATKEDISLIREDIKRFDGRIDQLQQNHITHLSAHHVTTPKP